MALSGRAVARARARARAAARERAGAARGQRQALLPQRAANDRNEGAAEGAAPVRVFFAKREAPPARRSARSTHEAALTESATCRRGQRVRRCRRARHSIRRPRQVGASQGKGAVRGGDVVGAIMGMWDPLQDAACDALLAATATGATDYRYRYQAGVQALHVLEVDGVRSFGGRY